MPEARLQTTPKRISYCILLIFLAEVDPIIYGLLSSPDLTLWADLKPKDTEDTKGVQKSLFHFVTNPYNMDETIPMTPAIKI